MPDGISTSVQKAIFTALNGSSALTSLLAGHREFSRSAIYDFVPSSAQSGNNSLFPMVTIGEDSPREWGTDTSSGAEVTVVIHIWSRATSWIEAKTIADTIRSALHRQELNTPDHEFIDCEWENDEYIRDPDGHTLHCAMQFRLTLDELGFGD